MKPITVEISEIINASPTSKSPIMLGVLRNLGDLYEVTREQEADLLSHKALTSILTQRANRGGLEVRMMMDIVSNSWLCEVYKDTQLIGSGVSSTRYAAGRQIARNTALIHAISELNRIAAVTRRLSGALTYHK